MECTLLFNGKGLVKIPNHIQILKDYGIRSMWVEARPVKRIEGWYIKISYRTQKELDEWLKIYSDVWIDA